MKKTVQLKLTPTGEQRTALLRTLAGCNEAANFASERMRTERIASKFSLHRAVYADLKARGLAAQAAVRVIGKVADAYTTQRGAIKTGALKGKRKAKALAKPISFRPDAAQAFDDRNLSWNHGAQTISIWTTAGRIQGLPYVGSAEAAALVSEFRRGETDLIERGGKLYLMVTVDVPDQEPAIPDGFLGVDLGIVNIATTSDGANWSGGAVTLRRKKNAALRAKLQAKGTKSAKRLLKKRSGKEARFVRDINHQISKKITTEAKRTGRGIAIEDLKGIRERARLRKSQNTALHSWAFAQLGGFLAYKAAAAGVALTAVDPACTSQLCPACGTIGRQNRPNRDLFQCASCGHTGPADVIAAGNMATRAHHNFGAAINQPDAA
ncbi:RNA-guided endonuclease InsQ/TnpB family protein [Pseudarthrobacter sp. H2]|uniref:RNA-guided endonuclease InsQ/TnpB family protein n=1 Tax=Pseudarthrobacter sp. H2 TaxID=3418415 RepID=UPI003CEE8803